jgi:hypothetical protein
MKLIFLFTVLLFSAYAADAQKAKSKKPVKKSYSKTKSKTGTKIKTSGDDEFDLFICYEGGPCTFSILKGDTLVYEVNQAGKNYQMFVVPNKFDAALIADFNWYNNGSDMSKGKVVINSAGLKAADKYLSGLTSGDLKITDATSTLWLSEKSFKEITKGATNMSFDGGISESFSSPESDASVITINYKDKKVDLDGFIIESKPVGQTGRKELVVLNITSNLLIIKMDLDGKSIQLKEVRINKNRK